METEIKASDLNIAGLTPFSTVDWPGKLAAVLFLQGCPIRCNYCHNSSILDPRVQGEIPWSQVENLLTTRKGLLDGVIFSGGEALMQRATLPAIQFAKSLGYAVGLHTAGIFPRELEAVLPYLDWVGFDVKAPLDDVKKYGDITHAPKTLQNVLKALEIMRDSGVDFDTRTSFDKTVLTDDDLKRISDFLIDFGITKPNKIQTVRTIGAPEKYANKLKELGIKA
ncbi:MAG: anaerobic ribonucleoside-triphosphate reductase activating protein [Bifidobacteriaceae bacterium]|nr:anaerobic ribonucleoside-triphosphate reductase activating protein [Bifidobacteriaceae bacterium]